MTAARPVVLVTAFEPFGGSPVNPTIRIAELLELGESIEHARLALAILPVVSGVGPGSAWATLAPILESLAPDAVVSLGESWRAERIAFERVAVNLRDSRIADNAGAELRDAAVVDGGAAAHFATLPLRAMLESCVAAGVEAELSLSAGSFLCNEIMYRALADASARGLARRSGFIHVPQLPEQAQLRGGPSMPAESSARGIHAALVRLAHCLAEPDA